VKSKLIITTWLLSFALIVVSAYMHLSNVGIDDSGRPGYGVIVDAIPKAGELDTVVTAITPSAFTDRLHRGLANVLEVLIVAVVVVAWMTRKSSPSGPFLVLPVVGLLVSLVLAFLGAWYGSPLRYPWIMISNLVGGYVLFAIYWWLTMTLYPVVEPARVKQRNLRIWVNVALVLLVLQIILGAWIDAYYAAFAGQQGSAWNSGWSLSSLWQGMELLGQLQVDGSGQVITEPNVAVSIRTTHLVMAVPVFVVAFWLAWRAWAAGGRLQLPAGLLIITLLAQLAVGLMMVWVGMSLSLVVLHTVLAVLVLLGLLTLLHRLLRNKP